MVRSVDTRSMEKHMSRMDRVTPIATSHIAPGVNTLVLDVEYAGKSVRCGIGIGKMKNGDKDAVFTNIGQMCFNQLVAGADKKKKVLIRPFTGGSTGNIKSLSFWASTCLQFAIKEDCVVFFVAKNSTMYDKLAMILGLGKHNAYHQRAA